MKIGKVNPEMVTKVKSLYDLGVSIPKIGKHLKISRATAYLIKTSGWDADKYLAEVRKRRAVANAKVKVSTPKVENAPRAILERSEPILDSETKLFRESLSNKIDLIGKVLVDLVNVQKDLLAMEQAKEMARKAYNAQKAEQKRRFF